MPSTGRRVPPSPKPKICNATTAEGGKCQARAVKGKHQCAKHLYDAEKNTADTLAKKSQAG